MGALDGAGAVDGNGGGDLRHFQVMDSGGGADQVDNRIHGPDLVEMDGFHRNPVKLGFGLGHMLEHGEGGAAHFRGQPGFLQKIADLRPVPAVMMVVIMMMVVTGFLDQKTKAGETSPDSLFRFENDFFGELKAGDRLLKDRQGHAQMEKCGAEHVSADAGRAVEMEVGCRHGKRID